MRRWIKDALVPLALTVFLLPALLPMLRSTSLPCTHDNSLHYFRILALRDALQHGWLFSRWVPNLALGYGYPFFNYREPLAYVGGELLAVMGLPLPLVLGILYAIGLIGAAWGAYALARELFGERAGWVAGVAYGLAPYLLLDALRRGNMQESVALALLPWLLLIFRRIITRGGWRPFVTGVALLAMLFIGHNITTLLFAPFLGGYVALLAWLHRDRRHWPWAFVAVALAVGLAAWFLIPALGEQGLVQLHLSRTTRNNDFRYNFATWREMLLTWPLAFDVNFLNAPLRLYLGVTPLLLGVAGLGWGLWRERADRERRALLLFFAGMTVAYLWMSTAGSRPVWEAMPMLAFVQFPWRLIGRAALPLALLAAALFADTAPEAVPLLGEKRRWGVTLGALALLVIFAWPETYPPKGYCSFDAYPTMDALYAYELAGHMGVDPEGSYFPIWVETHPQDMTVATAFVEGALPARLDVSALPPGARVLAADYGPLRATLTLATPEAFTARWLGLYFPGWQVRINGAAVPVAPEQESGLLTFAVPAGEHEIEVYFGETFLRRAANFISLAAVAALGAILALRRWRPAPPAEAAASPSLVWPGAIFGGAVALLLVRLVLIPQGVTPVERSRLNETGALRALPPVTRLDTGARVTPMWLRQPFDAGLQLTAYARYPAALGSDEELTVDLWWLTQQQPPAEYRASVQLVGPDGLSWSPAGTLRPRGYEPPPPSQMWQPGHYVYDPHIVLPLPGTPPGVYTAVASLFVWETLEPASALGADGNPLGPTLPLTTVTLTRPAVPPTLAALDVPEDAAPLACGDLQLWAFTADRLQAAPGEIVGLRWVWEALAAPAEALSVTLTLHAPGSSSVSLPSLPLAASWWPTDQWRAGERWVGRPVVRLPGGLESGDYRLALALPGCEALAHVPLTVVAPERVWDVPTDLTPLNAFFGEQVRLAGYAIEQNAEVQVTLAWQAVAEMTQSYRVFVHLVDEAGRLAAQSDGEPAAWSRPTTGWAVGEVVTETRVLSAPGPGRYTLRVGLYLPDGPRLTLPDGQDAFELTLEIP